MQVDAGQGLRGSAESETGAAEAAATTAESLTNYVRLHLRNFATALARAGPVGAGRHHVFGAANSFSGDGSPPGRPDPPPGSARSCRLSPV